MDHPTPPPPPQPAAGAAREAEEDCGTGAQEEEEEQQHSNNEKDPHSNDETPAPNKQQVGTTEESSHHRTNSSLPGTVPRLAPFNPSHDDSVSLALDLFQFDNDNHNDEVLVDVGCGDGRVLMQAAQQCPSLRCIGVETNPQLVQRAWNRLHAQYALDVQRRVDIRLQNAVDALLPPSSFSSTTTMTATTTATTAIATTTAPTTATTTTTTTTSSSSTTPVPPSTMLGHDCRDLTVWDHATALYLYLVPTGIATIMPHLTALVQSRQQQHANDNDPNALGSPPRRRPRPLQVVACTFSIRAWHPAQKIATGKSQVLFLYHYPHPIQCKEGEEENSGGKDKKDKNHNTPTEQVTTPSTHSES